MGCLCPKIDSLIVFFKLFHNKFANKVKIATQTNFAYKVFQLGERNRSDIAMQIAYKGLFF